MKQSFLVVYEYGQGGVWAYVSARSKADIVSRYSQLTVVDKPPRWMTAAQRKRLQQTMRFDIDDPTDWLSSLGAGQKDQRRPTPNRG